MKQIFIGSILLLLLNSCTNKVSEVNKLFMEEEISMRVERDTILFKVEKNRFLDMITNEYEITLKLLDSFNIGQKVALQ